ncbi:MAG: hypothetical protein RI897_2213 [Verrucomicrobiota bacterium]|jgi:uncharacterized membrane protein YsdA (DUF1294 family)
MHLTLDNAYPLWLLVLSAITLAAFGWDKICAIRQKQRISEITLLTLILLGGFLGGLLGRALFRHKTRKLKFSLALALAGLAHTMLLWLRFRGAGI